MKEYYKVYFQTIQKEIKSYMVRRVHSSGKHIFETSDEELAKDYAFMLNYARSLRKPEEKLQNLDLEVDKKDSFEIEFWYFKPSGKFYTEGKWNLECTNCGTTGHKSCYMKDAVDFVKDIQAGSSEICSLPGLSGKTWSGPIIVNCHEGFPVLIAPEKLKGIE